MNFEIDKQTLSDLNIFPSRKDDISVFDLFKSTETSGGQHALIKMMKLPSNDLYLLQTRVEAVKFLQDNDIPFQFMDKMLDFTEHYLNLNVQPLKKDWFYTLCDWITFSLEKNNDYYIINKGINYLQQLLIQFKDYLALIRKSDTPSLFVDIINDSEKILNCDFFNLFLTSSKKTKHIKFLNYFDHFIRTSQKDNVFKLIGFIYTIDALTTIANAGKKQNYCLPVYHQKNTSYVHIEGIFHPFVENPVTNSILLNQEANMCFLTGANMAGKSTFLKAIGICSYLAHIGFPVPAVRMETSIFCGLITTINLGDDINKGYSHFYGEVKRVKNAALSIKENCKVLVIFDELFRGTNVKDAYDASLMVISAFADIKQSVFFISTHIVEVAEELKNKSNILFKCFESKIEKETPIYTYKLTNGISNERHGLRIVKNEGIVEILQELRSKDQIFHI